MIRKKPKKRIGRRINIIVLGHVNNDQVTQMLALMDKYRIKSKVLFNHYGRTNKCKRELDKWLEKYKNDLDYNFFTRSDNRLYDSAKKTREADKTFFKNHQ